MASSAPTPQSRVKEFGKDLFHVDNNILFCSVCSKSIDYKRRDTIADHLKSKKHLDFAAKKKKDVEAGIPTKRQKTIESAYATQSAAATAAKGVVTDWIEASLAANIPIEKSDSHKLREFFQHHVKNGGSIPKANALRDIYLPMIYEKHKAELIELFRDKFLAIVIDETTDVKCRFVANILFIILDIAAEKVISRLAHTEILERTNHATIAQVVIKTLVLYGINMNNVLAFVTDNAGYMRKCFRENLTGLLPNAVHVTCWAHICSLLGDTWLEIFSDIDKFVTDIKRLFSKACLRQARYRDFLIQAGIKNPTLPPKPVLTRWNSWFEACVYHSEHMEHFRAFVEQELKDEDSTQVLESLHKQLQNDFPALKSNMQFIATESRQLIETLKLFECRRIQSINVYNKAKDLLSSLRYKEHTVLGILQQRAFSNAANKLEIYLNGRQPAIDFFKAVRILDPKQAILLRSEFEQYNGKIPLLDKSCEAEWPIYLQIVSENAQDLPVEKFWLCLQDRLPKLSQVAKAVIGIPSNSVDAERSFSKLAMIQTSQRLNMTEKTLAGHCMLYYNCCE